MEENDERTDNRKSMNADIHTFPLIDLSAGFDAVILGNGDYPTHPLPLRLIDTTPFLCCCDGAAVAQTAPGRRLPDAIVGDGDSLPDSLRKAFSHIIHTVSEQEDNDLTKATRFCMARGMRRLAYIGTTGRREDHTLGNISLMVRYMSEFGLDVTMLTDYGWFVPAQGRSVFGTFAGQQVSIFNIDSRRIDGEGFVWNTYAYSQLWQGTLNEAKADTVTIDADGMYLVFRTFTAKEKSSANNVE